MSVSVIPFVFPGLAHVRCAFQTRPGGVSCGAFGGGNISFQTKDDPVAVAANRRALGQSLGITQWAELRQVHGDALHFDPPVVAFDALPDREGDGLATSTLGLALCVKTADCQPILLAHKGGRHIAALHAGWRGNRCNFPQSAVERFCARYDLEPRDIFAVRGPSLGPGRAEFINFAEEWSDDFRPWFDTQSRTMDLWALTREQLGKAGLEARNIYGLDLCTASLPELFFSYRTEKESGRQASVIWIG